MPDENTPGAGDTPNREAAPDEASFRSPGVSTGAAGSSMGTSTSGLQQSIDDFTSAVTKLDSIVNQMSATQGGGGSFPKMGQQSASTTSFPKMSMPSFGGPEGPTEPFPQQQNGGQTSWTMTGAAYNDEGQPQAYTTAAQGGGNGGAPPFPPAQSAPSSSPTSQPTQNQQASSMQAATKPTVGGVLGSVATAAISYGASKLPAQLALNAYQQQSALGAPAGMSTAQAYQQAGNQALGTGGGTGNILAQNPSDAVAEWSALQGISGTSFPGQTQLGQAAVGATGAFSYLNPGISAQQAAQQTAQLYNPMSSMKMRALGYQSTPMKLGGGANQIGSVAAGIQSRWGYSQQYIKNHPNAASLMRAGLSNQYQPALGAIGENTPEMRNVILGMTQAEQGKSGMTQQQASGAFSTLASTSSSRQQKTSAEDELKQHGVQQSLVSSIQTANAPKGEQVNDQSKAYAQSLQATTQALANFRAGLNEFFDKSGTNTLMGHVGGVGAGASLMNMGALGGGAAVGMKSLGLLGKLFGKGGGGAGGAGDTAAAGGSEAGADAAAAGGEAGAAGLGGLATGGIGIAGVLGHMAESSLASRIPGRGGKLVQGITALSDPFSPGGVTSGAKDIWDSIFGGGGDSNTKGGGARVNANSMQEKQRGRGDSNIGTGSVTKQAEVAVAAADAQVGTPYVYGKEQPGTGFDCSGLTQWAYKQAGINLPRLANEQWSYLEGKGRAIDVNKAQEGDLVFSNGPSGTDSHVALVISNQSIVAADTVGTNVRIRGFQHGEWLHAGRPAGNISGKPLTKKAGTRGAPRPNQVGNYSITTGDQGNPTADLGQATQGFSAGLGLGDESSTEGSINESGAVSGAVAGGITAGSGYTGKNASSTIVGGSSSPSNGSGKSSGSSNINSESGELTKILSDIGAPASSANMSSMTDWANKEGFKWPGGTADAGGKYNPLNTTEDETGATNYNSTGVKNYPNPTVGATANAAALNNGLYTAIVSALKAGSGLTSGSAQVQSELSTWSGGGYTSVAAGGQASAGQIALVGERGPELVKLQDDMDIYNATQTAKIMKASATQAPGGPWAAGSGDAIQYSPYTPVYSGGLPTAGGGDLYLNFGTSSIKINMSGSSSGGSSGSSGTNTQAIAESMVKHLAKSDLYNNIQQGKK